MKASRTPRAALVTAGLALGASTPARGQPEPPTMAIVRPAGGFLAGSEHAEIPLLVVVGGLDARDPAISGARITASQGRTRGAQVIDRTRVLFFYRPPPRGGDEIFDVALTLDSGDTLAEAFTGRIPVSTEPDLTIGVTPDVVAVGATEAPTVTASSTDPKIESLVLLSNAREIDVVRRRDRAEVVQGHLTLPRLPSNAPSFVQVVAVAVTPTGYRIEPSGVRVRAPIRLSVDLPPESHLVLEGAARPTPPVPAAARGKTELDGVMLVYGQRLRLFSVRAGQRRPLSAVIPTGFAAPLVVPIPGQTMADGGTGDTLAVVVAPSPLGGRPFWPAIRVEGARLVHTVSRGPRTKVLVLERPSVPRSVRVRLDDEVAATIDFGAGRAHFLTWSAAVVSRDERAAALLRVTDVRGAATDTPAPQVRIRGQPGVELVVERPGPGVYRVGLPSDTPGPPASVVEVVAELSPPATLFGEALGPIRASTKVELLGPAPVSTSGTPTSSARAAAEPSIAAVERGWRFGLAAAAIAGSTTAPLVGFGGELIGELRFPFWRQRLALRAGVEFVRMRGDGDLAIGEGSFDATTTVAGFRVPLDVGFAVIDRSSWELVMRAGAAVRIERATLDVDGDRAASGDLTAIGGRAGVDAGFQVGRGDVTAGVEVVGIGVSLDGVSNGPTQLSGDLLGFRGEIGYRIWF